MSYKHGKESKLKKATIPPKTRKEIRKEVRREKKLRRSLQYRNSLHSSVPENEISSASEKVSHRTSIKEDSKVSPGKGDGHPIYSNVEAQHRSEKKEQRKLILEMKKSRKKTLMAANEEEDRNIRKLEKLLKLNKHKRKNLPKSFVEDGLSYLLDVCNPSALKESAKAEQTLYDSGSEFEEDLAVIRGVKAAKEPFTHKSETKSGIKNIKSSHVKSDLESDSENEFGSEDEDDEEDEEQDDHSHTDDENKEDEDTDNSGDSDDDEASREDESSESEGTSYDIDLQKPDKRRKDNDVTIQLKSNQKRKFKESVKELLPVKKKNFSSKSELQQDLYDNSSCSDSDSDEKELRNAAATTAAGEEKSADPNSMWEDIYGRMRDKDGNILQAETSKYIPPALRAKMLEDEDSNRKERIIRLKRQMKGLINRLAENNMPSISTQIEEMYMTHSRHDMNSTLFQLCLEALVSPVLTPERLVMEHVLLISVLHANVGSEVGAHFLQNIVKKFQDILSANPPVANKELDNLILVLAHFYNFRMLHASLLFEILDTVSEKLNEKRIELLLVVLRSVGFSLRKDDPIALKNLILSLQNKAVNVSNNDSYNSRMKFMLDTLLVIKNNNVSKIPSYDPEYVEHLKKLQRNLIRRGNYVTELKITLEDLLKVDERGRWWIVGSAWTGHLPGENPNSGTPKADAATTPSIIPSSTFSAQLLELARKQRMNTGIRKDIFCILMTAEDYMDAFEKLLHLGLKNQQRQEIIHILFDCCLQEKTFNPFYAHLGQRFCEFDRQYQMKFQYCLWDKLKEAEGLSNSQLSNLAQFVGHLLLEKGLPLSVLKVISFAEMDKACVRLVRQILLAVLLSKDPSKSEAVFYRISISPQLYLFREGIRLFISHFVLRKSSKKTISDDEVALLHERAKAADRALKSADTKFEF